MGGCKNGLFIMVLRHIQPFLCQVQDILWSRAFARHHKVLWIHLCFHVVIFLTCVLTTCVSQNVICLAFAGELRPRASQLWSRPPRDDVGIIVSFRPQLWLLHFPSFLVTIDRARASILARAIHMSIITDDHAVFFMFRFPHMVIPSGHSHGYSVVTRYCEASCSSIIIIR